ASPEAPVEGHPCAPRRLVQGAVAVVVDPVALLGAPSAARPRAALDARSADRACVDAGAETRAELSIRAARADERMALVDDAVAVVVERVAARLDALVGAGIEALPPERPTAGRSGAGAHPVRVAEARRRREPLVGRAVAVVVASVADLGACEVARVLAAVRGQAVAVVVAGEAARERAAPARARRDAVGIRAD